MLCRILTELKLLGTQVGIVTLTAGVGNDVVGWILLALSVALVNAGSGIDALYILLVCVGYILLLVFGVRPPFLWVLRKTGSIQNGPTQSVVALTLLLVLASSFFTAIIGVHAIFGAFLMGLICPHEGGFAIKLTEKLEDLVTVFFLPLYFALSGLSTNIGLLDSGITWAYVVAVIAIAFAAKMTGGTLAARANGLLWRESFTIGTLMSCKGLVELIVLNIGLQAKILSTRTFTIFVVMALVTTFATTPLVTYIYPPHYQKKVAAWRRGEIDWNGKPLQNADSSSDNKGPFSPGTKRPGNEIRKLLVALRLDSLPSIFTFIDLLGGEKPLSSAQKVHPSLTQTQDTKASHTPQPTSEGEEAAPQETTTILKLATRPLQVFGLRLFELTERLSSVMQESEVEEFSARDPVINAFHTFGQLHNVAVSGTIQLGPTDTFADTLAERAQDTHSDMILLPWSDTGSTSEIVNNPNPGFLEPAATPFSHPTYNAFVEDVLRAAPCATAVFVSKGFGASRREETRPGLYKLPSMHSVHSLAADGGVPTAPLADRSHHIFFPFIGGRDDHVALRFVLRLAQNPNVTATILRVENVGSAASSILDDEQVKAGASSDVPGEAPGMQESDDEVFAAAESGLRAEMRERVVFMSTRPNTDLVERARQEVGGQRGAGDLVVVGRRAGNRGGEGIKGTLGALAAQMIEREVKGSLLVLQAGRGR